MTEKQKLFRRLCAEILDIPEPNQGANVDDVSMAIHDLRKAAAYVWRLSLVEGGAIKVLDHGETIATRVIDGVEHYAMWVPVKEKSNG